MCDLRALEDKMKEINGLVASGSRYVNVGDFATYECKGEAFYK